MSSEILSPKKALTSPTPADMGVGMGFQNASLGGLKLEIMI